MSQKNLNTPQESMEKGKITEKQKKWIKGGIFFAIILGLFIVNNLNGGPENGPYPPNYIEFGNKTIQLSQYSGKVVILDFWATWCAPCRKGIPEFVELKKEYENKGLEIIGISVDDLQNKDAVENFIKEFKINYPVVWGNQSVRFRYGGIQSVPTTFVLDKEGNVFSHYVGYTAKETFRKDIEIILAGNTVNRESVKAPDFELPLLNDIK
ncbi:MAG: hypothetical protein CVV23_08825 [Ignavibacteriae bacterium HGW-Ignavibacteriae-2]|nr:TlpA family protein disulfide reductase [Bacteroidota bacterium]PKL88722.1 MAG: hypothetical protein CVV23_08825 [Ignavibacteriae bacterium HGW-Ignavibacteriae-2]